MPAVMHPQHRAAMRGDQAENRRIQLAHQLRVAVVATEGIFQRIDNH